MTHKCYFWNLQPWSWYFETCWYFTKCFFHQKRNQTWLLLIKMVNTSLMTSLPNDVRLKKISKLQGVIVYCPAFFPIFFIFFRLLSILYRHAFKAFENRLVFIDVWRFPWTINRYWKFILLGVNPYKKTPLTQTLIIRKIFYIEQIFGFPFFHPSIFGTSNASIRMP